MLPACNKATANKTRGACEKDSFHNLSWMKEQTTGNFTWLSVVCVGDWGNLRILDPLDSLSDYNLFAIDQVDALVQVAA